MLTLKASLKLSLKPLLKPLRKKDLFGMFLHIKKVPCYTGVGGIRTLVPAEPANAFRVRLVMTTSIRLHIVMSIPSFAIPCNLISSTPSNKLLSSNRWQIFHTDELSHCMGGIYHQDTLRFLLAALAYSLRLLRKLALRAQTCARLRC